ncbi:hypothetical protein KFE25_012491 [Diacronema lutheri]|uniref:Uncharacterized protein n=1 Tax=Diacronema lutheri TaxID=2081491 RepID=A0A8J6CF03_DIALT|nr:hypothetical protein KFE25_012491 [Diacronema lutheri]
MARDKPARARRRAAAVSGWVAFAALFVVAVPLHAKPLLDAAPVPVAARARRLSHARFKPTAEDFVEWKRQADELREQMRLNDELREANRQAFAGRNSSAGPRRLGVCVSGQMARLELERKVEHLFKPNRDDFVMDVVFALAPVHSLNFAYAANNKGGRKNWTVDGIYEALGDSVGNGTVVIDNTPQYANPMLQPLYMQSAYFERGPAWTRSAVKMWSGYWLCYQHFTRLEQANGAPYDMLVKVRDDGWVVSDIALGTPKLSALWKGRVIVPECRSEGGYADRWAIMDAAHGYAYFGAQLLDWYFNFEQLWATEWRVSTSTTRRPGNAENHLKGVLALRNVPVAQLTMDSIPIIQSRLLPNGTGDGRHCASVFWSDLGRTSHEYAQCVPHDAQSQALIYCNRCDDGRAGHSLPCEEMCSCLAARNTSRRCEARVEASASFCLSAAVLARAPIEQPECGMCLRHRCSLWGGNKCASRWGFTDPQGTQRLECECACCRQACGRERMCDARDDAEGSPPREERAEQAPAAAPTEPTAGVLGAVAAVAVLAVAVAAAAAHARRSS